MHRIGRFVFQGQMRPLPVINLHRLINHRAGLLQVPRPYQQEFRLQYAVHSLRQGVLIAVVAVGHRALDAVLLVQRLVAVAAVLSASDALLKVKWILCFG